MLSKIIGHRGAAAYAPENTIAGLTCAQQRGASWVEFDITLTQDEQVICLHDETLDRTTNGHGKVQTKTWASLESLDAGSWFAPCFANEPIPTLQAMLACAHALQLSVNIELKPMTGDPKTLVQATLACVQRSALKSQTILFSSNCMQTLKLLRQCDAHAQLGRLYHTWDPHCLLEADALEAYSIHCFHRILSDELIHVMHQRGYKVLAYTVNDPQQAQQLFDRGVDSIFSDYPDLMHKHEVKNDI